MANKRLDTYGEQTRDITNSLVLCLPLLLIYELGLLYTGGTTLNGVDFMTVLIAKQWGLDGLLVFNGVVFVAMLFGINKLKREQRLNPSVIVPVTIESTVYALLMGTVIVLVMQQIPGLLENAGASTASPRSFSLAERVLLSLGAGFHEELVFRLCLFGGLFAFAKKYTDPAPAAAIAVLVSSALFSCAHYLGTEPFHIVSFTYRFLAGALFCALFWFRGFAVAVYTHTIYDIYVLVGREMLAKGA